MLDKERRSKWSHLNEWQNDVITCLVEVLLGWCNTHMFQISRDVPGLEGLPHVKKSIDGVEQEGHGFQNGAVQTCYLLLQGGSD